MSTYPMTPSIGRIVGLRTTILLLAFLLGTGLFVLDESRVLAVAFAWLVFMLFSPSGVDVVRPSVEKHDAIVHGMIGAVGGGGAMLVGALVTKTHIESLISILTFVQQGCWFLLTLAIINVVVMLIRYLSLRLHDASEANAPTTTLPHDLFGTVLLATPLLLFAALIMTVGQTLYRYHIIDATGAIFQLTLGVRGFVAALLIANLTLTAIGVIMGLAARLRKAMGRAPIDA